MCQICVVTKQSTLEETPSFSKINTASPDDNLMLLWIGLYAQIWHIYFPTPPPCNGNISALELAIVTNNVSLQNRKKVLCSCI